MATVGLAYLLLPLAAWALIRALTATLNGSIWLADAIGSGTDGWTIVATAARVGAGVLTTPEAAGTIAILVVVAALAVWGLQRLAGREGESAK